MPEHEWRLWLGLAVGMLAVHALCWLLARGLGARLGRAGAIGGLLLPLLLLAPWLGGRPLLVPSDLLGGTLPGIPALAHPDRHALLNDAVYQFLPWELEVRHALAARRLPLWSDLLAGGSSPWVNPQAAVLSPLALPARLVPIQYHLLVLLALKILVAFEGTWLLARRLGRSRPSSLLAAAGFALGGGIMAWALFPHTATAAWVPWLTLGVITLFRHPSRRAIATTAVITGALLLSGHPETAAIGGLFATLCGLSLRRRATGLLRGLGAAALAAILGFALAAPQLLPFLHVLPESQRAHETLAQALPPHHATLTEPSTWFLQNRGTFLLSPLNPYAFGRPYRDPFKGPVNWAEAESGYAGLLALTGSLIALLALRDRRARPLLAFAALALLLPSRFIPLAHLLHTIPFMRVPAYARFLLIGSLALSLAGAFGTDHLLKRARARPFPLWLAFALAAALSLTQSIRPHVLQIWGLLLLAVVIAQTIPGRWWGGVPWGRLARPEGEGFRRRPQGTPPHHRPATTYFYFAAVLLLTAALLLDLLPWARSLLPRSDPGLFYPRTEFLAQVGRAVAQPGAGTPSQAVGGDYLVYPALLPAYGIADPRPHDPLAPVSYLRVLRTAFGFNPTMDNYFARFANVDHPLLDFLGVKMVVASVAVPKPRTLPPADGGRYAPFYLYSNPDALPRWFLPAAVDTVADRDIETWIARLDDGGRVALLREEAGSWQPAGLDGRVHPVRFLAAKPGHLEIALPPGAGERLLASSVPFSDGWRVTAAGAAGDTLRTLRVDGAFLGVLLPAGVSRVELRFLPPGLLAGTATALVALATCLFLLRRRQPTR